MARRFEDVIARKAYGRMLASPPPDSVTPLRDASGYVLDAVEWPFTPDMLGPAKIWKIESRLRRAFKAKWSLEEFIAAQR